MSPTNKYISGSSPISNYKHTEDCCIIIVINPWHAQYSLNDIDGLVQDCCNSIAIAMELLLSCVKS